MIHILNTIKHFPIHVNVSFVKATKYEHHVTWWYIHRYVVSVVAVPYRANPVAHRDKGLNYDTGTRRQNYSSLPYIVSLENSPSIDIQRSVLQNESKRSTALKMVRFFKYIDSNAKVLTLNSLNPIFIYIYLIPQLYASSCASPTWKAYGFEFGPSYRQDLHDPTWGKNTRRQWRESQQEDLF